MIRYYFETSWRHGSFLAESDEEAREVARKIKDLMILYTEESLDNMRIFWDIHTGETL